MSRTPGTVVRLHEELAVYCWCGRRIQHVPKRVIDVGATRSCGQPACKRGVVPHFSAARWENER